MSSSRSQIMDHTKMTFAELERHVEKDVVQKIQAFNLSAVIQKFGPEFVARVTHYMIAKPRKNQAALSESEKNNFNEAIAAAISAGTYATEAAIHAGPHMMHSFMGPAGTIRFLPWHRAYLYVTEQLLQRYVPSVTIPYWDWANDHKLPSWVILPDSVTRGPDNNWTLPNQNDIDAQVLNQADYTSFTTSLEKFHNTVHMWVGGNRMPQPTVSPEDPMFWLHHANVDRIWAQWQIKYPNVNPPLFGIDAAMDPWALTATDMLDVMSLDYYYV